MKCPECRGEIHPICQKCGMFPEWINVKDRLPDLYDFVLVVANNKGTNEPKPIAIARIVSEHEIWDLLGFLEVGAYQDIEYGIDRWSISHWMPMPQPPKDE